MSRFFKTFLFALFVGNGFAVVPPMFGRFAHMELLDRVQRVAFNEGLVLAGAYAFALAWAACAHLERANRPVELSLN